jgi:lipopolysaccharide transport system permease protein
MGQRLIIEAGRSERQYWRDLWRYRELFAFMAWRDLLIRYKQTAVGVTWSLLRPFLTMVILTAVALMCGQDGGGAPLPLFVFSAMLPWQFFSTALSESGTSLINNANLISKVYFPRLVVPASSVITSFVDFLIAAAFAGLMLIWYRLMPAHILILPFFVLLTFGASFGAGLWISALMVKYRDFRFIVPFIVQFGLYTTPLFKMTTKLPEHWAWHGHDIPVRLLFSMNPVVGIVDGFRWSILGGQHVIYWPAFTVSVIWVFLLVWTGLWYFRKTERKFADLI